jgi:hypothetical protein
MSFVCCRRVHRDNPQDCCARHLELLVAVHAVAQDATQLVRAGIQVVGPLDAHVQLLRVVTQQLLCRRESGIATSQPVSWKRINMKVQANLPQTVGTQAPACLCLNGLYYCQRCYVLHKGEPCACIA